MSVDTAATLVPLVPSVEAAAREVLGDVGGGSVDLELGVVSDYNVLEGFPDSWPDKVAVITLNNPTRRNALSGRMMIQLAECIATLETAHRDLKLVVVRGARTSTGDSTFCSGADLSVATSELATPEKGELMCRFMQHYLQRLRVLPALSVASVTGAAVGGGSELATACDFRVMHARAFIQFVHTKMGVSPGWGGGTRLTRLVGRREALKLLATAHPQYPMGALDTGLVDHVWGEPRTEPGSFDGVVPCEVAAAVRWATPMLHGAAASLRGVKQVVATADDVSTVHALAHERAVFASLWGGPAAKEAISKSKVLTRRQA